MAKKEPKYSLNPMDHLSAKDKAKIVSCGSAVSVVGLGAVSAALAHQVARPRHQTMEEEIQWQKEHGFWDAYQDLETQDYLVRSYDGYLLHCTYVPAEGKTDHVVILSHGYTSNRLSNVKYIPIYRDLGYDCIIYDLRGHGENQSVPTTMGVKESRDLVAVICDAYTRLGAGIRLGLHGESMGAATSIMALKRDPEADMVPNLKFVVSDCGYADLNLLLREIFRSETHVPEVLTYLCYSTSAVSKLRYGFAYSEAKPVDCLNENEVPVCFMHGAKDTFIDCMHSLRMQQRMKKAGRAYQELHLFEGAGHAESFYKAPGKYTICVETFLRTIGEI